MERKSQSPFLPSSMDERSNSGKGRLVWLQREALGRGKTGIPWAPDLKVAMKDSRFQHAPHCSSRGQWPPS